MAIQNMRLSDAFILDVAAGNIAGMSFDRKFGSIDSIQAATPADVWEYGTTSGAELYTFSADGVADIDTMSGSNAGDTVPMTIEGLADDGTLVTQTKNLTGQTKVTLDTPLWRVNRAFNSDGSPLAGDVYIYVDGAITAGVPDVATDVRAFVSTGNEQTLQTIYTVPAGKTAYFMGLESSLTKGTGSTQVSANLKGKTRAFGKQFRTQDEFNLLSHGSSTKNINFPIPIPFPEKTDFCPNVDVSSNGLGVSWAFTVLLVDN